MSHFRKVFRRNHRDCKKLIIAVHGMGEQDRNQLACSVASLVAHGLTEDMKKSVQAIHLPVGLWEGEQVDDPAQDDVISFAPDPANAGCAILNDLGFAEIYWSDLTQKAQKDGHRLEPGPIWARSVVDRLRQRHDLTEPYHEWSLQLGATVVEEVAETIKILQNLLTVTKKAGVFDFDLGTIVEKYLGDVQQVADFRYVRGQCAQRFAERVAHLAATCPGAQLHFVAHSEGSVLTLLTLLNAMHIRTSTMTMAGPGPRPAWLDRVRSLTTLGSPIDKHLLLWPEMWGWLSQGEELLAAALNKQKQAKDAPKHHVEDCSICEANKDAHAKAALVTAVVRELQKARWFRPQGVGGIRWRNYYDKADPVGYDLDTAREKLDLWGCDAFSFPQEEDVGFKRYPMAGQAHVDYFTDVPLFRKILEHIAFDPSDQQPTNPKSAWIKNTILGRTSFIWPFVITGVLHLAAVLSFQKSAAIGPTKDEASGCCCLPPVPPSSPDQTLYRWSTLPHETLYGWSQSAWATVACGLLLYGTTVMTRMLAISVKPRERWMGLGLYAISLLVTCMLLPGFDGMPGGAGLGDVLERLAGNIGRTLSDFWSRMLLLGCSGGMVLLGIAVQAYCRSRKSGGGPLWALRFQMMTAGVVIVFAMLGYKDPNASLMMAICGALMFLFLWWLGMLLFDLCYVWKRYINTTERSTFVEALRARTKYHGLTKPPGTVPPSEDERVVSAALEELGASGAIYNNLVLSQVQEAVEKFYRPEAARQTGKVTEAPEPPDDNHEAPPAAEA